jgi:hypothetical protein
MRLLIHYGDIEFRETGQEEKGRLIGDVPISGWLISWEFLVVCATLECLTSKCVSESFKFVRNLQGKNSTGLTRGISAFEIFPGEIFSWGMIQTKVS